MAAGRRLRARVLAGMASVVGLAVVAGGAPVASATPAPQSFPVPAIANPMAVGSDGSLWFLEARPAGNDIEPNGRVGRLFPDGHLWGQDYGSDHYPSNITRGRDGSVLFQDTYGPGPNPAQRLGRVAPGASAPTFQDLPLNAAGPVGSLAGAPDGSAWLPLGTPTEKLSHLFPDGHHVDFLLPSHDPQYSFDRAGAVAVTADGTAWTATFQGWVAAISPSGQIREFPEPVPDYAVLQMVVATDGNLWFGEVQKKRVTRVTPAGVISSFPVPYGPSYLAAGTDGGVWFSGDGGLQRISAAGAITTYPMPGGAPDVVAAGATPYVFFSHRDHLVWRLPLDAAVSGSAPARSAPPAVKAPLPAPPVIIPAPPLPAPPPTPPLDATLSVSPTSVVSGGSVDLHLTISHGSKPAQGTVVTFSQDGFRDSAPGQSLGLVDAAEAKGCMLDFTPLSTQTSLDGVASTRASLPNGCIGRYTVRATWDGGTALQVIDQTAERGLPAETIVAAAAVAVVLNLGAVVVGRRRSRPLSAA